MNIKPQLKTIGLGVFLILGVGSQTAAQAASATKMTVDELTVNHSMSIASKNPAPPSKVSPSKLAAPDVISVGTKLPLPMVAAPEGTYDTLLIVKFLNHVPIRRKSILAELEKTTFMPFGDTDSLALQLTQVEMALTDGVSNKDPVAPLKQTTGLQTKKSTLQTNDLSIKEVLKKPVPNQLPSQARNRWVFSPGQQPGRDQQKMQIDGPTVSDIENQLADLNQMLNGSRIENFEPLFTRPISALMQERQVAEKAAGGELADLANYYRITFSEPEAALDFLDQLDQFELIEHVYFPPVPKNADIAPATSDFEGSQGYLESAASNNGIDAFYAWDFVGGRGELVKIMDVEVGWNLEHEDLPVSFSNNGFNFWENDHGTAVLGEIVALDDGSGVTGIANASQFGTASVINGLSVQIDPSLYIANVADAINVAAGVLDAGDIVLIEQHAPGPGSEFGALCNEEQWRYVPMENWQAEFDAIKNATARGVLVVEAAGNGGQNLDHARYNGRFNRNLRDSGAIMVGGGTSDNRAPMCWTNFGSRLDVQGWGENVMTLGYGDIQANGADDQRQWYTTSFSGTSSASPIVVGAAAVLQGIRKASGSVPFTPLEMRNLLVTNGTPQTGTNQIGPLPNLRGTLDSLGITPDNQDSLVNLDGSCTQIASQSGECGGNACVRKPAGYVEGECFLGIPFLCEDGYQLYHTDQFICAD